MICNLTRQNNATVACNIVIENEIKCFSEMAIIQSSATVIDGANKLDVE